MKSKTEIEEPRRAKSRNEIELPMLVNSKMERFSPNFVLPITE
jgi:hypothetical protein